MLANDCVRSTNFFVSIYSMYFEYLSYGTIPVQYSLWVMLFCGSFFISLLVIYFAFIYARTSIAIGYWVFFDKIGRHTSIYCRLSITVYRPVHTTVTKTTFLLFKWKQRFPIPATKNWNRNDPNTKWKGRRNPIWYRLFIACLWFNDHYSNQWISNEFTSQELC